MSRPKKKKIVSTAIVKQVDTAPTQPKLPVNKFPVVVKNNIGRPSDYSTYTTGIICGRIVEGESLRKICRDDEMPHIATVFRWLQDHREFSEQYARAVENRVETHVEEIYDIADDATNDYVTVDGKTMVDHEHIQRSKLRVDVRKWAASKMKPKKYGDITTQKHTGPRGDDPIQVAAITIKAEDMEPDAREMLRQALLTARQPQTHDGDEGDDDADA